MNNTQTHYNPHNDLQKSNKYSKKSNKYYMKIWRIWLDSDVLRKKKFISLSKKFLNEAYEWV